MQEDFENILLPLGICFNERSFFPLTVILIFEIKPSKLSTVKYFGTILVCDWLFIYRY